MLLFEMSRTSFFGIKVQESLEGSNLQRFDVSLLWLKGSSFNNPINAKEKHPPTKTSRTNDRMIHFLLMPFEMRSFLSNFMFKC